MAAPALDLAEILKEVPPGDRAAVSDRTVIAHDRDIESVIRKAKDRGIDEPVLVKAPDQPQTLFF